MNIHVSLIFILDKSISLRFWHVVLYKHAHMHAYIIVCVHARTHPQSTQAHNNINVWILDSNGDDINSKNKI